MTKCMSHILINTSCRRYVIFFKTLYITSQTLLIFASFYRLWYVSFIEDLTIPYMIGCGIEATSYLGHRSHKNIFGSETLQTVKKKLNTNSRFTSTYVKDYSKIYTY